MKHERAIANAYGNSLVLLAHAAATPRPLNGAIV
jgi:hypothetical protein